uniref:Cathepsin C n=1 Tax=Oncorhynchus mykiss TaxID=8022 RepID=A0A8K9V4S4_ONCMY
DLTWLQAWCDAMVCVPTLGGGLRADTPANCTYEDLLGFWVFQVSEGWQDKDINCSLMGKRWRDTRSALSCLWRWTTWETRAFFLTLIYNQGFEVVLNDYKWLLTISPLFQYSEKGSEVTSYCDQTLLGWVHDSLGNNWACFTAKRLVPVPLHSIGCDRLLFFSSTGMLAARVRIQTNNTETPIFNPQQGISCSQYSQGSTYTRFSPTSLECTSRTLGSCFPYIGKDSPCDLPNGCLCHYSYMGGFYRGCTESAMILELVKHGPIEVCSSHSGGQRGARGASSGSDECAIESIAMAAKPIPKL